MDYYLAIDIGASSGRHIIFALDDKNNLSVEEIYRFPNGMEEVDGHLCWNTDRLFSEIINGMRLCKEKGFIPKSIGIDTWAVDYVLLDHNNRVIDKCYGYRDQRMNGMDRIVEREIDSVSLYRRTGIQKQLFNTIYQLMCVKINRPEDMEKAESFMMIPDYFAFLLTGCKGNEYTNATTTQLISVNTKTWDYELINKLGLKASIFGKIFTPGSIVGGLTKEVKKLVGYDTKVVRVATHDTASAVLAVPSPDKECVYISSGTWSLMGVELNEANLSYEGMRENMTNEGGYNHTFRFLKNIMGLWIIQSFRKECAPEMSYEDICALAKEYDDFDTVIDVNSEVFFAPKSMKGAIDDYCKRCNLKKPESIGEYAAVVYKSLAVAYKNTLESIERITGKKYERINIVGGGANASYLNELTAKICKREVIAGPTEATAIGNLLAQLIADGKFTDARKAREFEMKSFDLKRYTV